MTSGQLILAIEGGGTKTDALLADSRGNELTRARGGPGNLQTLGTDALGRLLGELLARLFAGREPDGPASIGLVSLAMAGADSEADHDAVGAAVRAAGLTAPIVVHSDARATFFGACPGTGLLVIAGTGSIAFGRNPAGEERRSGGWGHDFGDEGSAYDLGRRALLLTCRAVDGRSQPSLLTHRVLQALGVAPGTDPRAALLCLVGQPQAVARLAPVVLAAAGEHDPTARGIVDSAARSLLEMITAVASALGVGDDEFRIALYGGLLTRGEFYRTRLVEMIHLLWPRAVVSTAPEDSGLRGALHLGLAAFAGEPRG